MIRRFVRAVVHNATVTAAEATWPVSVRIDPIILRAADVLVSEELEIVNTTTGERFTTFAQAASEGSGEVRVHSGPSLHVRRGDIISLLSYGLLHDGQTLAHKSKSITLDAQNRIVSLTEQ